MAVTGGSFGFWSDWSFFETMAVTGGIGILSDVEVFWLISRDCRDGREDVAC